MLVLFFGVIDYGYMLNRDTMVNNTVRDAARVASLGGTYAEILDTAERELAGVGIPSTAPQTTITIDCIKADGSACAVNGDPAKYDAEMASGATAVVKVSYAHDWITPFTGMVSGGDTITLAQTTQMRIE